MISLKTLCFLSVIIVAVDAAPFLLLLLGRMLNTGRELRSEVKNERVSRDSSVDLPRDKTWKDICNVHYPNAVGLPGVSGVVCQV